MPSRVRAVFGRQELRAVLALYDLPRVRRLQRQLRGSNTSPKLIISTQAGRFLLKRRAHGRDDPRKVAAAHAVQEYLAARGFPLPSVVRLRDGQSVATVDGHIYELFEYAAGGPYDRSAAATLDAGRVLGLFHRLMSSYRGPREFSTHAYHDAAVVRTNLHDIPRGLRGDESVVGRESELLAAVTGLCEAYDVAARRTNRGGWRGWPRQIVHADWHPGNMLFEDGRVSAVIDYDSLHVLPAVTDLANGALQFSIVGGSIDPRLWPAEPDLDRLRQFLIGYQQEVSTPAAQARALPYLMIEALIAEAVVPIAATGSFGRMGGLRFLQMIFRKVQWLRARRELIRQCLQPAGAAHVSSATDGVC